jgi:predicted regulator of amino acid metabolism with ACT domain
VWHPQEDVEEWFPGYIMAARILLTLKQQYEGTSNKEAMEISCSGDAEQYITDVLHDSEYEPHDALRMIFTKDIPQKIVDKWKPEEMVSIVQLILYRESNI